MIRRRRIAALVAVSAVSAALVACGSGDDGRADVASETATPAPAATAAVRANRFNASRAFSLIRTQVEVGQRPAGSPQLRKLAGKLRRRLPRARYERIPGEPKLRNIVGTLPGRRPAIVVGAHYDTLVTPKGFVGANNGAAGSAIVVELARTLAKRKRSKRAPAIEFVLFDGEEPAVGLPEESDDFYNTGLRGSRAFVDRHGGHVKAMVLLDYVAGKGLRLPREGSSDPALWEEIRTAARATGNSAYFPDAIGVTITDDHTPFLRRGIPAVDLIDWNYPGHSLEDGLDKLSLRSVDAVGETVYEYLRRAR